MTEPWNKGKTYPAEILTPEEVRAILAECPATWTGTRDRALLVTMYRAGLRHAEALALYPKDVDLRAGTIAVLHGKGDRRRTVGIDPGACDVINLWTERRARLGFGDRHHLFCTTTGRKLAQSHLRTVLRRYADRAGITKRVHPHGLRHTHAYELMMEGIELKIIQMQLGHLSMATTDRYLSHIAPKQVIEKMRERIWEL